jgi:DNA-binding transcriptional LysR family regulator
LGESVSGELVVTSLLGFSQILAPMLAEFQAAHPDVRIRLLTGERLFRLEYGEAHVAIRAGGTAPDQPDNVVQPLMETSVHLVASDAYIARHGMPKDVDAFGDHRFVGYDNTEHRAPFARWLAEIVPDTNFAYRASDERAVLDAVVAGAGIGFILGPMLDHYPTLKPVMPSMPEWSSKMWLVTHVDLHRTTKVQTFLSFVKDYAASWSD